MDDLRKTVLVTGGSRGVGEAIVRRFAQDGHNVVLHFSTQSERAEKIGAELGESCAIVSGDLSQSGMAIALWSDALAAFGSIDLLVNNAATAPSAPLESEWDLWQQAWQTTLQVNLVAVADLCRLAIEHFRSRGGGRIVNIASRAAHRGETPEYLPYGCSKAGVIALTKSIARYLARDNILAFSIAPGFISTEMSIDWMNKYGRDSVVGDNPLGEMASPEEIANLVAFLSSDQNRQLNGATIDVNGGSYVR